MTDYQIKYTNARLSLASLTGVILGVIRFGEIDEWNKYILLQGLIHAHNSDPLAHSAEWLEQWQKEFAHLLKQAA